MKYTKPEIVLAADAVSAIQNMAKHMAVTDNVIHDFSTTAYEADE
jgi:hypothetical protein